MNRLFLLLSLFHTVQAVMVRKLVLVNTSTGEDIMEVTDGTVINRKKHGEHLSLRVDVAGRKGCITMVLDDKAERSVSKAPYYLAGIGKKGTIFDSATLQQVGEHKLLLRPCLDGKPIKVARGAGKPKGEVGKELEAGYAMLGIGSTLHGDFGVGGVKAVDNIVRGNGNGGGNPSKTPGHESGGGYASINPSIFNPSGSTGNNPNIGGVGGGNGRSWGGWDSFSSLFGGNRNLEEEHDHHRELAFRLEEDVVVSIIVSDDDNRPPAAAKVPSSQAPAFDHDVFGAVTGELRKWHRVTFGFEGPPTSEYSVTQPEMYAKSAPAPDYRCDLIMVHRMSGKTQTIPCFFAGNGDAANGNVENGNVWLAHFRPDETGVWNWTVEFKKGTNVAQNGGGDTAGFFDGVSGSINIDETDKTGRDLRAKGRLQYVGEHYLKFAETGEYFLKAGPDSPSNFLAFDGFDGTPDNGNYRKNYAAHSEDYVFGQETWNGSEGRNILGAINHLANAGMNVLTVNLISDDGNVFPWSPKVSKRKVEFDISKLAQWEIVFDHAEKQGVALHIKFQETDDDTTFEESAREDHRMSEQRKIFYREMVARFGHYLGVTWNLGRDVLHPEYIKLRSEYIRKIDPYNNPILVQATEPAGMLSSLLGVDTVEGVSLHSSNEDVQSETLKWLQRSAAKGRKWVVSADQQADVNEGVKPDSNSNFDVIREQVLYGNLMAGGYGAQYFFGLSFGDSDLDAESFKSRTNVWKQSKFALDFFGDLPLGEMSSKNGWLVDNGTDSILATEDGKTIVYYKTAGSQSQVLDFPNTGKMYSLKWFNPRTGTTSSRASMVISGGGIALTNAPSQPRNDWVVIMTCSSC